MRLWLFLLLCAPALSQNTPLVPNGKPDQSRDATYQSNVNLVLVPVVVRDSHGHPLGNLTKDDFQLFDKRKRQTIAAFSRLEAKPKSEAITVQGEPLGNEPVDAGIQSPGPGPVPSANSSPGRFLIYLFDDRNTAFADLAAVRAAAVRHWKRDLAPGDRAAIYTFSGRSALDFTGDRQKLEAAVAQLLPQPTFAHGATACPNINYYLADLILNQNDDQVLAAAVRHTISCAHVPAGTAKDAVLTAATRELVIGVQDYRPALIALRRAINRLAKMPGQRVIVLATPGFPAQTPDALREITGVLNLAASNHVVIGGLDVRGLIISEPDATDTLDPGPNWIQYVLQGIQADNQATADLAKGTGGLFFHNSNDLSLGFQQLASAPEFSYVLGFSPAAFKPDGSFHALRIRLPNQKRVTVLSRPGYYAFKQDTEDQMARASVDVEVFSRDQISDIPIILQTGFSKANGADHAKIMVTAKMDANSLHFQKKQGVSSDSLIFVSALFDPDGAYVTGMTKTVNLNLRDETLAHVMDSGFTLRSDFDAKVGTYAIRLVIKEARSNALTTRTRAVTIP